MKFELEDLAFVCEDSSNVSNIHDDLKREAVFASQALAAAVKARRIIIAAGLPFDRPVTYQAQMLKTLEQMGRIDRVQEDAVMSEKKREDARKQRINRKMGKQIQVAREQEKAKQRTQETKRLNMMRKKRSEKDGTTDDFDIEIDSEVTDRERKLSKSSRNLGKPMISKKREARNERYGFGGKKRGDKRNTRESVNEDTFNPKRNKTSFFGASSKSGGNRPGKQRRQQMRSKKASRK